MTTAGPWVADPHVAWQIVLAARLAAPVADLAARVHALEQRQGWPHGALLSAADPLALATRLASEPAPTPLTVGTVGPWLVVAAHHSVADGLALLAVLHELTGLPVRSSARGLGDRPATGSLRRAMVRRLREVALQPPARVAPAPSPTATGDAGPGDAIATLDLPGRVDTARLVHAGLHAVIAHNTRHGRSTRHPVVAVGASRSGGSHLSVTDDSALLRLRGLKHADVDEIRRRVRTAPTEPPVGGGTGSGPTARAAGLGVRLLAPRLGSTLLVSHLGAVEAPGVTALAFHPVTGGGSGVSLGAVEIGGTTTLSLRARARQHGTDALQEILEGVRDRCS